MRNVCYCELGRVIASGSVAARVGFGWGLGGAGPRESGFLFPILAHFARLVAVYRVGMRR